jgi:hypothetical protein
MIVDKLDIERITVPPHETEAPLVVDADTVLTSTIAAQQLEPVPGRYAEAVEVGRGIDLPELAESDPLQLGGQPLRGLPVEQPLSPLVGEALDHVWHNNAKRD